MKNGNGQHYPGSELQRDIIVLIDVTTKTLAEIMVIHEHLALISGLVVENCGEQTAQERKKQLAAVLSAVQKKRRELWKKFEMLPAKKQRRKKT